MTDETIFAAALEKADPAERSAFLTEVCDDDTERRERLEGLLAAHAGAADFLECPAVAPQNLAAGDVCTIGHEDGTRANDDEVPLGFLAPGTRPDSLGRIGHYEVLQVLGQGGFGIVFRAFDDLLHRVVAVKVLSPQLASTSPARKRFLREARSSAQVRHENVVQVHEVGEQPLPYIAMEFIPGEALQQRLDRTGPLDVADVVRIGRQIAEGLAAAHATDLIHRDVKPGNVLLEGGAQRVKITDFGLARAADDASLSQSGIIAGTPMYMAPEQATGETLDQRADLFSLGSVLYVMAAGRPPFRANGTLAVLKRVADDAPRPIREIIPETPQWLCDIISKLHAKKPEDRFQSAREVADVLADWEARLKADPKVQGFSRIPRGKVLHRRRALAKWVAMAALLLGIGISFAWRRGWVNELFGGRPPSTTDATSRPVASRTVAWGDVVDPLGDCRFHEADGRLIIEVPGGPKQHDLNLKPGWDNLNAPRVLREVEGDFEARVTVSEWVPDGPMTSRAGPPYVAAGLVVWQDENHFFRLCRTVPGPRTDFFDPASYNDVDWFWGAGEPHRLSWGNHDSGTEHLRIRRVNGVLFVALSRDGQEWIDQEAKTTGFSCTGPVRVGVVAINRVFQDFAPEFGGFAVNGLPPSPGLPNARPFFIAPLTDAEVRRIAALPAAEQVEEVRKDLMRRNPGFDGEVAHKIEDGIVTELRINTQQVTDISPLRVFDALRVLTCRGTDFGQAPFADLAPLKGMNLAGLAELDLSGTKVGDAGLAQFKDCKYLTSLALCGTVLTDAGLVHFKDCTNLTFLELGATGISDAGLAHFKDCKSLSTLRLNVNPVTDAGLAYFKDCKNLTDLGLGLTQVTDAGLAYFEACKNLENLNLFGTKVSDVGLAYFKDCKKLTTLSIEGTKVTDLSLLKRMPLKELWCDFQPERDAEILRAIKTLETINDQPTEEFWKSVEKK